MPIDLKVMNQQRITVLAAVPAALVAIEEALRAQGYDVEVLLDPKKLYSGLSDGRPPGFVMISSMLTDEMAKTLPDFVVKHFKVPVIMFREDSGALPDAAVLPNEIFPMREFKMVTLEEIIKGFPANYEKRIEDAKLNPTPLKPEAAPVADEGLAETLSEGGSATKGEKNSTELMEILKTSIKDQPLKFKLDDKVILHTYRISIGPKDDQFIFAFPDRGIPIQDAVASVEASVKTIVGPTASLNLVVESVQGWFFEELKARADDILVGTYNGVEICALRFAERTPIETLDVQKMGQDIVLVPIEEWWTTVPLPCPCYIWLGLNSRRILYIRAGRKFRPEAFKRFQRRGFTMMSLDPSRLEFYLQIRQIIRRAIEKNPVVEDKAKSSGS